MKLALDRRSNGQIALPPAPERDMPATMLTVLPALALLSQLAVDGESTPRSSPRLPPRSSIAAVLARRGELGLDDAEVKRLEEREVALQKQLAEMRLDDADTAAWLEAEALLKEPHREPARDVAEEYREALADERDAERRKQP